jgi:hypothetical protein
MSMTLIDPRAESTRERRQPAKRLSTLEGKTIGLLDISKPGGNIFLDHLERLLVEKQRVASVVRLTKPTFTKPAPDELIETLVNAGCDAVIEALAD